MNYEYRIRELEAELDHIRKLQEKQIWEDLLARHEAALKRMTEAVEKLSRTVDQFIEEQKK